MIGQKCNKCGAYLWGHGLSGRYCPNGCRDKTYTSNSTGKAAVEQYTNNKTEKAKIYERAQNNRTGTEKNA